MSVKLRKALVLTASLVVLAFIWGNSLLSGEKSGQISGGLLRWLKEAIPLLRGMPELLLRKLGHFSEFAALGFLLCWLFRLGGQQGIHRFSVPLLCGMLAANIDETIQVFRPNRGPSVIDVWIDVAGVCLGIGVFCLLRRIRTIWKGKSK